MGRGQCRPVKHTLVTERLVLRPFETSDQPALQSLLGDPTVMEYSDEGPLNTNQVRTWLEAQMQVYQSGTGLGALAVLQKPDLVFIGYCGLFSCPDIHGNAEIEVGYRLLPTGWGQGFATEAALAIRHHAFTRLGLRRLVALVDPSNRRSVRVAEKLGMRYETDIMMEGYDYPDRLYTIHNPDGSKATP